MRGSKPKQATTTITIVGGGFGGIRCALDLARRALPTTRIQLISNRNHFEYHAALYRVVTGRSPLEVCIPLDAIFHETHVELLHETVLGIDVVRKTVVCASGEEYQADVLVLGLGSETAYFAIPGLEKRALGFKSIQEALELKRHFHTTLEAITQLPKNEQRQGIEVVVVGAGASGVELAGELAVYLKDLARQHGLEPHVASINLVEAAARPLATFAPVISEIATRRLGDLGVRVLTQQRVEKESFEELFLSSMTMKTRTVIWTAGTTINRLYRKIRGLRLTRQGRVKVNELLEIPGWRNVFVLGDAAATPYSGLAQTADDDGRHIAAVIQARLTKQILPRYQPHAPKYAIPIGPGWAIAILGPLVIGGWLGWLLRRAADLRFFLSILPLRKALIVFRHGQQLCESCPTCCPVIVA